MYTLKKDCTVSNIFCLFPELTDPSSEVSRSWSGVYLLWYAYLSTLVVRCKYYHAWLLSEAICNNSGMGFNGYDNDGTPKWDKMSNIDVFGFEVTHPFSKQHHNSGSIPLLHRLLYNATMNSFEPPPSTDSKSVSKLLQCHRSSMRRPVRGRYSRNFIPQFGGQHLFIN